MHYYVIDSETTGVDVNAAVCEVAWVKVAEDFSVQEEHQSILDPVVMISPSASGVHGLTNADCESYPTLAEYFSQDDPSCYGKKLAGPAVVMGHRVGFDMRFLAPHFEQPPLEIDTLRWVRKLYPEMENHQLSTCIFALNLPRSAGAHRAMADVYSALHLVRHICDRTGMTLPQLAEASRAPIEIATVPFGKWKGTEFSKVPRSYLRWMKENMTDLDQDMRYTIQQLLK